MDEGDGSGGEQAREQSERSSGQAQGQAAAAAQQKREEKQARKRDDGVVDAIIQFLTDDQRTHLSVLIARLVERDCPSSFILAVLSLINEKCRQALDEALQSAVEAGTVSDIREKTSAIISSGHLSEDTGTFLVDWIEHLQIALASESEATLKALRNDHQSLDGTVLQLSAFVLQDLFKGQKHDVSYEKAQTLAAGILQIVFEPYF